MPEVDTLVLTVVETQVKATRPEVLRPLVLTDVLDEPFGEQKYTSDNPLVMNTSIRRVPTWIPARTRSSASNSRRTFSNWNSTASCSWPGSSFYAAFTDSPPGGRSDSAMGGAQPAHGQGAASAAFSSTARRRSCMGLGDSERSRISPAS